MSPNEPSATRVGVVRRLLRPIVEIRDGESATALLMFAYSFLAMTAYNIVRPITRSKFIADLGADNLPWVQLGAGLLIGVIMHGLRACHCARAAALGDSARRSSGACRCSSCSGRCSRPGTTWRSVAFYVLGLILGLLLISQFWTLANDIYDARHAKRLFGFIGGGASLGGATGAPITAVGGRPRRHGQPAARRRGCADGLPRARDADRSPGVDGGPVVDGRGVQRRRRRGGAPAPARIAPSAAHRRDHRLRGDGGRHHRAAAQHGGGVESRRRTRTASRSSWPRSRSTSRSSGF